MNIAVNIGQAVLIEVLWYGSNTTHLWHESSISDIDHGLDKDKARA